MKIFENNAQSIGRTPLVRLARLAPIGATILAKIEGRNPAGSVKCRVGVALIQDAEAKGLLKPGMEIIEPTSGNTGIALAFAGAARGYKLTIVMPESMSVERRKTLKAFGVRLVLTDGSLGMQGAIDKAREMCAAQPGHFYLPQQFENPANPAIHEATTGPEIWEDTDGTVDAIVAGVGTGGTLTGITRYLKRVSSHPILSVAVEPAECGALTRARQGHSPVFAAQRNLIQGLGAGFVPGTMDLSIVDRIEQITSADALAYARRLATEEGIFCGISSGAAALAAVRLGSEPAMAGKTIVTILPDNGDRYLNSPLFEGVFEGLETAGAGQIL